ncbi:TetR/AcrR family transcriptional regulator [bacterium]|nr:TetR/AcrR family transcriptional regulator [bacterium]MCI0604839.1 TetR/AcrR family transcriptional regulator [bacterium]
MRYRTGHKQETRDQIVRTASQRFRKKGAEGVAISDIMHELRLTHGGFYRHFNSKQQLFVEALKKAFEDGEVFLRKATEHAPKGQELRNIIERYLSVEHCLNVSSGCPVAALSAEVGRQPKAVRLAFDRAINLFVSRVARFVPGESVKERERKAGVLFAGMVGALSMARATSDTTMRDELLGSAREMYIRTFCKE